MEDVMLFAILSSAMLLYAVIINTLSKYIFHIFHLPRRHKDQALSRGRYVEDVEDVLQKIMRCYSAKPPYPH